MTSREKMGMTNLDMTSPLGWRQRTILLAIRELQQLGTDSKTADVVLFASCIVKLCITEDSDKDDFNMYCFWKDRGERVSDIWFYKDIQDALSIMRTKGWIRQVNKDWEIESKFIDKVNQLTYAPIRMISRERL